jgi:transcriptional regulator with XRE-family HTH domain
MQAEEGFLPKYDYAVNRRVAQVRKALGFTQKKFAEGIELSPSFQSGIEINHRRVNDRLIRMIALTYGVSEDWLRTGEGAMFEMEKDLRLGRIIRNFNKMDNLLRDYVMKYLDWLVEYYENRPGPEDR